MPQFGASSKSKLVTCDSRLQIIANEAIKIIDFSILEGQRSEEVQAMACESGHSQSCSGQGKHLSKPSMAFDFAPSPLNWNDLKQFSYVAGIIMAIGFRLGIKLRYGGDWNRNGQLSDEKFHDMGHIELDED